MPAYLDGDERMLLSGSNSQSGLPTWKQGQGATLDTTPLVSAVSGPPASGAAGQGASGNPNTPAATSTTQLNPENPWATDNPYAPAWPLFDPSAWEDPGFAPGHGLPGHHGDKAPIGAPAAALDTSSIADNRLGKLWSIPGLSGSSEYYGVKPGNQTGSANFDDTRNQRLPLPGQGQGAGQGPVSFPLDPTFYLPILPFPPREAPHGPLVPNPGSGHKKSGGTPTKPRKLKRPVITNVAEEGDGGSNGKDYSDEEEAGLRRAMEAQRGGWLARLSDTISGNRATDNSDPDDPSTNGKAVWDAALPWGGAGGWLYDRENAKRGGALDDYYNRMTPGQYNNAANGAILTGNVPTVGAGLAVVLGGGAALGVGTGGEIAAAVDGAVGALGRQLYFGAGNLARGAQALGYGALANIINVSTGSGRTLLFFGDPGKEEAVAAEGESLVEEQLEVGGSKLKNSTQDSILPMQAEYGIHYPGVLSNRLVGRLTSILLGIIQTQLAHSSEWKDRLCYETQTSTPTTSSSTNNNMFKKISPTRIESDSGYSLSINGPTEVEYREGFKASTIGVDFGSAPTKIDYVAKPSKTMLAFANKRIVFVFSESLSNWKVDGGNIAMNEDDRRLILERIVEGLEHLLHPMEIQVRRYYGDW